VRRLRRARSGYGLLDGLTLSRNPRGMHRLHETLNLGLALVLAGCEKPAPPEVPTPAEAAPEAKSPASAQALPPAAEQPATPPTAKRAPCDTDQSCNDNPAVSALWGRCVDSVCQCRPGFELTPWGTCKPGN
jgi:hypothetical protein